MNKINAFGTTGFANNYKSEKKTKIKDKNDNNPFFKLRGILDNTKPEIVVDIPAKKPEPYRRPLKTRDHFFN